MKLKRRNWSERNFRALSELLADVGPGEAAVFDWDNTCAFNDIGEALLRRLTFGLEFRMDAAALASSVPDRINGVGSLRLNGRPYSLKAMKAAIFSAYERLQHKPSCAGTAAVDEDYRVFTSGLLALNRGLEETPGIGCGFAYPWMITLHQGFSLSEFAGIASAVVQDELRSPIQRRAVTDPQKRWRHDWISGIRVYPEMRDLAACWQERGGRVIVSTASKRQLVEKMIAVTGFPCHEVIGMELATRDGRFQNALKRGLQPNLGKGKVANIRSRLDREPALVAGDSSNDYEMLTSFPATRLRLVIDRHSQGKIAGIVRRACREEPGYLAQKTDPRLGKFKADNRPA